MHLHCGMGPGVDYPGGTKAPFGTPICLLRDSWGLKPEASMGLTDQMAMSTGTMLTSAGKGNSWFIL